MKPAFRWIKSRVMIYSTEDEDRVTEMFENLIGTDEYEVDVAEGEMGNRTLILEAELTKRKDMDGLFDRLGKDVIEWILDEIEERIDEDCSFFFRLDKQKAMSGEYVIGSGGDVVSFICKVASYPAKRELAIDVLKEYLKSRPVLPERA
ncbi:MAG: RNA-binding domain-containing protein [Candidatus Methanomethylophilaceae archaeon]|jgi:RNA binding exosome subunit